MNASINLNNLTLFTGEPSMDNPPLLSEPLYPLSAGNSFVFKGDYCTVTRTNGNGFYYTKQHNNAEAYMNWWFYCTIPSYRASSGIMVGVRRKILRNKKIMDAVKAILS